MSANNAVTATALVALRVSTNLGSELKLFADSVTVDRMEKSRPENKISGDGAAA